MSTPIGTEPHYLPSSAFQAVEYQTGRRSVLASKVFVPNSFTLRRRMPITFPLPDDWWLIVEDILPLVPTVNAAGAMRAIYSQIQFVNTWQMGYLHPLPLVSMNIGAVKLEFTSPSPLSVAWLQGTFTLTMMKLAERGLTGEYRVRFQNQRTGVVVRVVLSVAGLGGLLA